MAHMNNKLFPLRQRPHPTHPPPPDLSPTNSDPQPQPPPQQQQQQPQPQGDEHDELKTESVTEIISEIDSLQLSNDDAHPDPIDQLSGAIPPPPPSSSSTSASTHTTNADTASSSTTTPSEVVVPQKPQLIVVSNRLPVTITKTDTGEVNFRVSSGGLVSALDGVKNKFPFIWVGWIGDEVATSEQDWMRQRFQDELSCYPVFLNEDDADLYYNGFCNNILWPLFHYVPLPIISSEGERKFDAKYWHAYSKVNHRFADAVMQVYQPGALIWVQDYHLMLLPSLLRKRLPDATIGFFLHTPFPSSEVYRILPVRSKVLQGVLAADLIGFHTHDYAFHFLSVCTRILGLESNPKGVKYKDHFAYVDTFPIGIDPNSFLNALETDAVKDRITDLQNKFRGKKVVLGVDRLDYTKGVPHKFMAFEMLLANNPEWKHNVVLVQIGVPSRTQVDEYKKLISQTNELVGRINGHYGSVEQFYTPIMFMNQCVTFDDLCALYAVADVLLVTPIRDGMNLVSYEYVVCQRDRHGVLVLSEFAGSVHSLSSAIRVNPWNIEELAAKLHEALTLPERERKLKHQRLFQYVKKHTATYWAQTFVTQMKEIDHRKKLDKLKPTQSLLRMSIDVLPEMRRRTKRLFLVEYEGTLVEPVALPDLAFPSASLLHFLQQLSCEPENFVYIVSGRSRQTLENWFGNINVGLICEHGCDYVHPGGDEWHTVVEASNESWKESVIPILQHYRARSPGAHLEVKEKTITWHFRDAAPLFGSWQAKELQLLLAESCMNLPVEVISGPEYLELRLESVSRVSALERILSEHPDLCDFVFAIGSDRADEQVFSFLADLKRRTNGRVFTMTCRVGGKSDNSAADRYVPDSDVVFRVLKELLPTMSISSSTPAAAYNVGHNAPTTPTNSPNISGPPPPATVASASPSFLNPSHVAYTNGHSYATPNSASATVAAAATAFNRGRLRHSHHPLAHVHPQAPPQPMPNSAFRTHAQRRRAFAVDHHHHHHHHHLADRFSTVPRSSSYDAIVTGFNRTTSSPVRSSPSTATPNNNNPATANTAMAGASVGSAAAAVTATTTTAGGGGSTGTAVDRPSPLRDEQAVLTAQSVAPTAQEHEQQQPFRAQVHAARHVQ